MLNEYDGTVTSKLYSAQRCSYEDLMLFLADKRKLLRDFRVESCIPANIISKDSKKRKEVVAVK